MKAICVDVETTTHNNGAWTDSRNELVMIACYDGDKQVVFNTSPEQLDIAKQLFESYDLIVGFNIKFDLHWLMNYGIDLTNKKIYDVQLAEYIFMRQQVAYPSLEETAYKYLQKKKIDVIKLEYWDLGIQTTDIPWNILSSYALKDVELTWELYQHFLNTFRPHQQTLLSLSHQDLLVLLEMERNGLKYNRKGSLEKAEEQDKQIQEIQAKLNLLHSVPNFNWSSNDHVSALLYGGIIKEAIQVPIGFFKTGNRKGQVKYKWDEKEWHLPRIYNPIKGTERQKKGYYSVDEDTLLKLTGDNRELIDGLLQIRKLEKDNGTYLRGLPSRQDEGFYSQDMIYGSFGQTTTKTGRLNSSKPNLQNLSETCQSFFVSRYE